MNPAATKPRKAERNLSMECAKLIASFFVVFIHAPFPGKTGELINCLACFAVPMFFMISGYFNYGADSSAIRRRTKHIFSLIVTGTLMYLVWGCISTELQGGSTIAYLRAWIFDPIEIVQWVILHYHPYAGHLWYLNALAACYLLFWVYTKFWEDGQIRYQPFYYLALNLFVICFIFGVLPPANNADPVNIGIRDGWLMGIPMFGAGLFLREYQDVIFRRFQLTGKKLLIVILAGALFSILQWYAAKIGIMPFGTIIEVIALMLLLASHPKLPAGWKWLERLAVHFGPISTWIYITHLMVFMAYGLFLGEPMTALLGAWEPWLQPVIVLVLSIVLAIICEQVSLLWKKLRKK